MKILKMYTISLKEELLVIKFDEKFPSHLDGKEWSGNLGERMFKYFSLSDLGILQKMILQYLSEGNPFGKVDLVLFYIQEEFRCREETIKDLKDKVRRRNRLSRDLRKSRKSLTA